MLLKIAHICFCGEPAKTKLLLETVGYSALFSTRLRPMKITQQLLSNPVENFKMSFWQRPNSISIELLEFDSYSLKCGLIKPVFSGESYELIAKKNETLISNFVNYKTGIFLGTKVYYDTSKQGESFSFSSLLLISNNLNDSITFWNALGFRCVKRYDKEALLEFSCLFKGNISIHLVCNDVNQILFEDIDSTGFHVLAFISNSTTQEWKKMKKSGFDLTDIEQIKLNNIIMDIFYLRSPEGLIIEIISLVNS